ncbi:MAG: tetratricopeptide repeat protein [Deltaproteobacteria bacterium]|jgi:tetratricopeptide (TPR) repeat protein|nr:tetratricopeptide repeat protein [Deltaproteobacteria bacterium]
MKSSVIFTIVFLFLTSNALAAGSASSTPAVSDYLKTYNSGVDLMRAKEFESAEKRFREALSMKERFAEAHNNLAYTLRKQGPDHFDEALMHYNRAIELNPDLPEPYMYRGVLYVQMDNKTLALKDHQKLIEMGSPLAAELEYVVANGKEKEPEQFFGVSGRIN